MLNQGLAHCITCTGIDYLHPDLGGGFGPGHRVACGYDFIGDNGAGDYDVPGVIIADPDPYDSCDGTLKRQTAALGALSPNAHALAACS